VLLERSHEIVDALLVLQRRAAHNVVGLLEARFLDQAA
jgi:hypothetical protein